MSKTGLHHSKLLSRLSLTTYLSCSSMGGMLPTYLAATAPDRVLAGICIGPVHPTPAVADVFKQRVPVVQEGKFTSPSTSPTPPSILESIN